MKEWISFALVMIAPLPAAHAVDQWPLTDDFGAFSLADAHWPVAEDSREANEVFAERRSFTFADPDTSRPVHEKQARRRSVGVRILSGAV
jgi:hypothetical protein